MHFSTYTVILAAGSGIASAKSHLQIERRAIAAQPKPAAAAPPPNAAAAAPKPGAQAAAPAAKGLQFPLAKNFGGARGLASKIGSPGAALQANSMKSSFSNARNAGNSAGFGMAGTGFGGGAGSFNPEAAQKKRMTQAVDMADQFMTQYEMKHKKSRAAAGLRGDDNMPPPSISFDMGEKITNYNNQQSYNGPVTNNNNQQYAYGGGSNVRDGGKINNSVDNSRTDNSIKAVGSTLNGNTVNAGKNGNGNMRRRAIIESLLARDVELDYELTQFIRRQTDSGETSSAAGYDLKEDQAVVFRDFILLVKVMRRNPWAKEEVLVEFAGVPGMRTMVEELIQQYTTTDGQLTMNNFAALVDAMNDKTIERAVVEAFNSNYVYASIVEKVLIKYSIPEDQGTVSRRDVQDDHFEFNTRAIQEEEIQLAERDFDDEDYFWLSTRDLGDEHLQLGARDLIEDSFSADPELFFF